MNPNEPWSLHLKNLYQNTPQPESRLLLPGPLLHHRVALRGTAHRPAGRLNPWSGQLELQGLALSSSLQEFSTHRSFGHAGMALRPS